MKEGGKRREFKTKIGAADLIIVDGMTMTESGSERARRFVIIITTIILLLQSYYTLKSLFIILFRGFSTSVDRKGGVSLSLDLVVSGFAFLYD